METNQSRTYIGENGGYGSYGSTDYGMYCMSLAHQIAELRREVGETECGIKETLHTQSLAHSAEFCNVNKNITDNAHRNVIAILENRSALQAAKCDLDKSILENRYILADKMDREGDEIKERLTGFERNVDENFCKVRTEMKDSERRILDRLTADKLDEKNDLIDELRHMNRSKDVELFIGNKFAGLEAMVNSVKQEQLAVNRINNFGDHNKNSASSTQNNG